ncbi:phosphoribosylglycinamide formyltransferase [Luteimonas panaciterrae]|uniref:phosphoribosylglycinamide formyltransferase n=1 Tax=Luteimonas panaciterrae TaxID=363885 RepID=UPI001CFA1465|nr:phosphoribosylglycinamide formyltransferase [Luteimonas panaciterrae]
MPRFLRLAVLASGRGSNLQALIDAIAAGELAAEIVGVYSDKADAGALQRARDAGIPAYAITPKQFATRAEFDAALFTRIDAATPDLIVCAGYMRLITGHVVEARRGRIINIHPSLLPAFKGLHTHAQALAAGVPEHGASVHFVTADLDGGPVIAQARVPVLPGDNMETLSARVLAEEHPLLVETVRWLAAGRIVLSETGSSDTGPAEAPIHVDGAPQPPLQLGANRRFA